MMNPLSENIHSLIARLLTDQLDESEAAELEEWKKQSKENLREFNDIVAMWARSGSMKLPRPVGQLNAIKTVRKKAGIHSGQRKLVQFLIQAAAVLVLSVIFSGVYSYLGLNGFGKIQTTGLSRITYQEIKAAYGTQSKVELADGTTVFLNSGSKLRFPQNFDNQSQRKVFLDGEAFFTVAKNKEMPFIVQTSQLGVKVLGTTFNVDAYSDNHDVHIALVEGAVVLQDASEKRPKDLMSLSPNQVATLSMADHTLTKTDVPDLYKYTAWINGRIIFFGDPIQTVVKKLEKWYNVEVDIADKSLENYRFTGTFIDESLEQILSVLSLTSPMTYEIQAAEKQADNSMSKRRITLKNKRIN